MTSFRIERRRFDAQDVAALARLDARFRNWPVVYLLDDDKSIYVGESINVAARLRQHLDSPLRRNLLEARVVLDDTFNKSVCLDLESFLIRLFAGDGKFDVLNRNEGIVNAAYFGRATYQPIFDAIFDELRAANMFTRSIPEIQNTDLYKLSPFKALTHDQAVAVEDILNGLFEDIELGQSSRVVIHGDPGTGKTIVAIFLMKLLRDIQHADLTTTPDGDTLLSEFFVEGYPELLSGCRMGLVVPQQSLRGSIRRVFAKTPGLLPDMVMSPFDVGNSAERYDVLVVDETHRLNQRANQASGMKNTQFREINEKLFGRDDPRHTQLDWIVAQSDHQILLVDAEQGVRPADLPRSTLQDLTRTSSAQDRSYRLSSQMRVGAGNDYVGYIGSLLSNRLPPPESFDDYDLRLYDDFAAMVLDIGARDREHGLSRLVAGYAWPYASKRDRTAYDITIDGVRLRWNSAEVDWVNSPRSSDEVGSIHTIQGYDLNYAGVIIGKDLRFDVARGRLAFDRSHYFDKKGVENNRVLGITYADDDVLDFVANVYRVLLTRGIRGTYVYVCDPALRERLRPYIPAA